MTRAYQHNYSSLKPSVFDNEPRRRKAKTLLKVCQDFLDTEDLSKLRLLDVGSSSGIIDDFLADYFEYVAGIDIDEPAVAYAQQKFDKPNLHFATGDAMNLAQPDVSVDVVVCSHVYEHVPNPEKMVTEIYRVLKPGGICYFSGNNRVMYMEPHHRLPFLSLLPRRIAHMYMRLAGKGEYYHEQHLGYWALRRLWRSFELTDYSEKIISNPEYFSVDYMLQAGSTKWRLAYFIARNIKWATPHIWILKKPKQLA